MVQLDLKSDKTVNHFDIETSMTESVPEVGDLGRPKSLAVNRRFYWITWCDSGTDNTEKSQQFKSL